MNFADVEFESPDCANRLLHGWQCLLLVVRWLSLILRWQHDNICCVVSLLDTGCNEDGRRSWVCGPQTLLWLLDDVQMTSWRTAPLTDCSTCLTDCYVPTLHWWSLFVWTAWKSGSLGPPPVDTASACPSSCPLPLTRADVMEDNAHSAQLYICLIDWGSRLAAFPSTCVRLRPTSCWLMKWCGCGEWSPGDAKMSERVYKSFSLAAGTVNVTCLPYTATCQITICISQWWRVRVTRAVVPCQNKIILKNCSALF